MLMHNCCVSYDSYHNYVCHCHYAEQSDLVDLYLVHPRCDMVRLLCFVPYSGTGCHATLGSFMSSFCLYITSSWRSFCSVMVFCCQVGNTPDEFLKRCLTNVHFMIMITTTSNDRGSLGLICNVMGRVELKNEACSDCLLLFSCWWLTIVLFSIAYIQRKGELFQLVCSVITASRTIFVQLQQVQVSRMKSSQRLHEVISISTTITTKEIIVFMCMCVSNWAFM